MSPVTKKKPSKNVERDYSRDGHRKDTLLESDLPMVSVIAPCRNEAGFIEGAIKTILGGEYPEGNIELLVVDGMSTDGTREIVQKMARKYKNVRLIDNPQRIVPTAMNIGIREAHGEYIVRIDCHSRFAPDYISKCVEVLNRTSADGVGGYITTLAGANTPVGKAIAAATSSRFGVGNSQFRLTGPEQEVDTVPFGAYKKTLFEEIGLYDERLVRNQDIELNSRIRKGGGRLVISPEIKLAYYNRPTYHGLWQQAFSNGLWNPYTVWLVGGGLSTRHFVPMGFVVGLIAASGGALLWSPLRWALAGYVLLYLCAAACFAVKRARETKTSALRVLAAFVVLHVAYGLGSLWAVVTIPFKFPRREKKVVVRVRGDRGVKVVRSRTSEGAREHQTTLN